MEESALFICNSAIKLAKCVDKQPYYTNNQISIEPSESYVNVIKKTKKDNITPENICEIMLCQIPGISATAATAIIAKYPSIKQLIAALESDPECLGDVNYTNAKGQTRKINKNCAEIITNFLLA
jgi:hypothetical protein